MNQRGASLIELLFVLGIVAIVAVLAGPHWSALAARQQTWSVTRELAGELLLGRQFAMARHARVRVIIDADRLALRTELADTPASQLRRYEFAGRETTVESLSNGTHIIFHPSGRSATGNTIVLRDRQHQKRTITVSITGKVTIS